MEKQVELEMDGRTPEEVPMCALRSYLIFRHGNVQMTCACRV